jgi:hypothetical protein
VGGVENDSIRTSGEFTLVEVWIDGKLRNISVGRDAIGAFLHLPPDKVAAISDDECREFVRKRSAFVVAAAREKLRDSDPNADTIALTAEQMRAHEKPGFVDRRKGDRRKTDRRKSSGSGGLMGDRRQADRRKGDRRKRPASPKGSSES